MKIAYNVNPSAEMVNILYVLYYSLYYYKHYFLLKIVQLQCAPSTKKNLLLNEKKGKNLAILCNPLQEHCKLWHHKLEFN